MSDTQRGGSAPIPDPLLLAVAAVVRRSCSCDQDARGLACEVLGSHALRQVRAVWEAPLRARIAELEQGEVAA